MYKNSICNICENEYTSFIEKENVIGIAYGYKTINGLQTDIECILTFVTKKVSKDSLNSNDIIPSSYNNIPTDVIESGDIVPCALSSKIRPMQFGYSIGPASVQLAGTAGCLVKDKNLNYYILSNNHILAGSNTLPINTPIIQPGAYDGGTYPNDGIATLSKFIPIKFISFLTYPANTVDCAIAKVTDITQVTNIIANIGVVNGINSRPQVNLKVQKSGRTTGYTTGVITGTNGTFIIPYESGKSALFTNQIVTTSMTSQGDSGSLLLDNNKFAVGLSFASSQSFGIANPISTVLEQLGVFLA